MMPSDKLSFNKVLLFYLWLVTENKKYDMHIKLFKLNEWAINARYDNLRAGGWDGWVHLVNGFLFSMIW